jgi:hypothetical protein
MVMEHVVSRKGAFEMNEDQSCILGIRRVYFIWGEILKVSESRVHLINSISTIILKVHHIHFLMLSRSRV